MTKALTFDQSITNTGWAFGDEHADPRPGSNSPFRSGVIKAPKRDELGERLAHIFRSADALIDNLQPDIIGYEEPYFPHQGAGGGKPKWKGGKPAESAVDAEAKQEFGERTKFSPDMLKKLQMVKGVIITLAALRGIPVAGCTPSQWRKTFLGYGIAPKGEAADYMKHAVRAQAQRLGHDVSSFDECDAIGIHWHTLHGGEALKRKQGSFLDLMGKL